MKESLPVREENRQLDKVDRTQTNRQTNRQRLRVRKTNDLLKSSLAFM